MSAPAATLYSLSMLWTPASGAERARYAFTLTNHGSAPLERFSLCFSGPACIDPSAPPLENVVLLKRLSNHVEVMPPDGGVLAPGASWTFTARGTQSPLRHWTDAARGAYLACEDGRRLPVAVGLCQSTAFGPGEPKLGYDRLGDVAAIAAGLALVPWPAKVRVDGPRPAAALRVTAAGETARAAVSAFAVLVARVFPGESFLADASPGGIPVLLAEIPAAAGEASPEAYRIDFAPTITIAAASATGLLYGLITLGQIVHGVRVDPEHCRVPATGEIVDRPRFGWRGSHLDVARQFYPIDEIETFLALMAWNKLNRLHLHLTDDEAWRYEVEAYPELTRIGAFRGAGLPIPALLGSGAAPYGGFYTKAELRRLIARAATYGIAIVPEVDMPGHCWAALTALPRLRDPEENHVYHSIQGFENNCLNAAVPATRTFVADVVRELIELFPSRWIHVGADEVPGDAWSGSPLARRRLEELGGGGAHALQADFLRHLQAQINAAGRVVGAWEEGAHGDGIGPEGAYLVAWRNAAAGAQLAARGYDVVMAPGEAYYLDIARSKDWWEPGATWAGVSSVENSYRFDPLAGVSPENHRRVIGVQACIWSEATSDRRVFRRLVFPRLSAIAETGWTSEAGRDYERFAAHTRFLPYWPA